MKRRGPRRGRQRRQHRVEERLLDRRPARLLAIAVWTTASSSTALARKRAGVAEVAEHGVAPRASRRSAFSESRTSAVT